MTHIPQNLDFAAEAGREHGAQGTEIEKTKCQKRPAYVKTDMKMPILVLEIKIDMGELQFVGSLKLQVSFAKSSLFYRALLQKRPEF